MMRRVLACPNFDREDFLHNVEVREEAFTRDAITAGGKCQLFFKPESRSPRSQETDLRLLGHVLATK